MWSSRSFQSAVASLLLIGTLGGCGYRFGSLRSAGEMDGQEGGMCLRATDVADNFNDGERVYIEVKRALYEALAGAGHQDCADKPMREIRVQKWNVSQSAAAYNIESNPREFRILASIEVVSDGPSYLPVFTFQADTYVDYAAQSNLMEQKRIAAAKFLIQQIVYELLRSPLTLPDAAFAQPNTATVAP